MSTSANTLVRKFLQLPKYLQLPLQLHRVLGKVHAQFHAGPHYHSCPDTIQMTDKTATVVGSLVTGQRASCQEVFIFVILLNGLL